MHLRHLRYFIVAAEEENFNRAAERLNIAQPALSRRIRDLEAALGVKLFERERKRVHLSEAGRALLEDLRRVMLSIEQATVRCRKIARAEANVISIGINDSAIRHQTLSRAFSEFHLRRPEVELQIGPTQQPLQEAVTSGFIDAAFIHSRPAGSLVLDYVEVDRDSFMLAHSVNHPLMEKDKISLGDLRDEEFLWLPRESAPTCYDRMLETCRAGGLEPKIIQYILSESARLHLVAEGFGVSFITASFENFLPEMVRVRQVEDFAMELPLELVWRRDNRSPILAGFVEMVVGIASGKGGHQAKS